MASETLTETSAAPNGFAAAYATRRGSADEMLEADGSLRPHWHTLVTLLDDLGFPEILRRRGQAQRLIRDNGVSHNIYGDPDGMERPWNLGPVPLLIPAAQWKQVADGLVQRAKLLDAILADLYGPARCVAEGWLPAELLYANPAFLRPCHGITLPQGRWLHLYSADLVRLGGGEFLVLNDRTQAPSGSGYTLENRIVLSSILPTAFRQCNVHRLAPFFIALRKTLQAMALHNQDNPRIVLLTPGPYNETYFEHAYLARYLGYTLVQGNDLTVRDGLVFLKTLSGLQRVDVILRRVDDDFCDPLELYPRSFLGVPGLVQAVRSGNVAIANALGSGIAQSPALLPFLPLLSRNLLGEELKLTSVRTWWCGQSDSLAYVLENLPRLVIKHAYPAAGADPEFGPELSQQQLGELRQRITARPAQFVAQECVQSRTAPVLIENQVEARRFVLRAYAVADQDSYTVMSGGLTRVTGSRESLLVSLQKGGGSMDTWILSPVPVKEATLLPTAQQPVELTRGGGELSSRVADDLFWLGRYVQRLEADVRVARCLFTRVMENVRPDALETAKVLGTALLGRGGPPVRESGICVLVETAFDGGAGGLRPAVRRIRSLVRGLRDRVSSDAWRILQAMDRELTDFNAGIDDDQIASVVDLLNRIVVELLAFGGVVSDSMTRGQAWRFLDMGARIERCISSARLLQQTLGTVVPAEPAVLEALLEIADSTLTYRRRYFTQLQAAAVVDLLIADDSNPNSVIFQVAALQEHLAQLPRDVNHPQRSPERQAALKLRTHLMVVDLRSICQPGKRGLRAGLVALTDHTISAMGKISEWLSRTYFSHASISRSLQREGEEHSK